MKFNSITLSIILGDHRGESMRYAEIESAAGTAYAEMRTEYARLLAYERIDKERKSPGYKNEHPETPTIELRDTLFGQFGDSITAGCTEKFSDADFRTAINELYGASAELEPGTELYLVTAESDIYLIGSNVMNYASRRVRQMPMRTLEQEVEHDYYMSKLMEKRGEVREIAAGDTQIAAGLGIAIG